VPDVRNSLQLQVSTLLLDEEGELTQRIQAGRTLRAAILLDLVAAGALRNDADSIRVVPTADLLPLGARMLQDMTERPDESLVWWVHHEHISVKDAAQEMVDLGLWQRHEVHLGLEHRYTWREDAVELADALRTAIGSNYEEADHSLVGPNLALVGGLWGHESRPPDDDVLRALGRTNWLAPDLFDYLWRSAVQVQVYGFHTTPPS
jgi:hypothetical protein